MAHDWVMDGSRTRLEINVLVWRCRWCGCLQIKHGGHDAPSVYRPNDPTWSPFRTMTEEPRCCEAEVLMAMRSSAVNQEEEE